MTTLELATGFVALLKQHDDVTAAAKYNADDIISYEAMDGPMAVCKGKEAVKAKGAWWIANHEVHSAVIEGPYVNGDTFCVRFNYDITPKADNKRMKMDEVGIYTVENGKITSEKFCYLMG